MTTTQKFQQETELTADNCMKGAFWAESLKSSGWQHMETAPKDGTPILGVFDDGSIEIVEYCVIESWKYEEVGDGLYKRIPNHNEFWSNNEPIMWMPLPEPPTTTRIE